MTDYTATNMKDLESQAPNVRLSPDLEARR